MSKIILSLTQRLAWWTVSSRMAKGSAQFAKAHPAIVAAFIILAVLIMHPEPIWVAGGVLWINFNCYPMMKAIWFVQILGKYLIVCNPTRFSKETVDDAIIVLMQQDVADALSKVYGPKPADA